MQQINQLNLERKSWVETNGESHGTYNTNIQIRFKISMLRSRLCDYSDVYILVKRNITVSNTASAKVEANIGDKKVIFKNCASFTSCISRINNAQSGNC